MKRYDWTWLRDKLRVRVAPETVDVFQDNDLRFKLDGVRGFELDLKARLALRDRVRLAGFDQIEHFAIQVLQDSEGGDRYLLVLARIARCDIFIGTTWDQLQCSRVAARLGSLTGRPVVAP